MEQQLVDSVVRLARSLGGRALIVGGYVRDSMLGLKSKDVDIEVHGPVDVEAFIDGLRTLGRVDEVGRSFGVLKLGDLDISFPRRDSKITNGHAGFAIQVDQSMTVEEALSRRDFTINSMALDPLTADLVDPFGGLRDLKDGMLRHTSDAFSEDPLRVLRAVQFGARFMFDIASETADLCRGLVDTFDQISVERVWMEWEKILRRGQSMGHVTYLLQLTGWDAHFPEWCDLSASFTDRVIQHADSDGVSPERRMALILGSMFRGKPRQLDGFLASIDAPIWLRRSSQTLLTESSGIVDTNVEARMLARRIAPVRLEDWLRVHTGVTGLGRAAKWEGVMLAPRPPLLTGTDLIEMGLTPGPEFGRILGAALEAQDREGWNRKSEALAWLQFEVQT
jgi:tRNA nucleotidyltransferase (CCA-adding enzyme)